MQLLYDSQTSLSASGIQAFVYSLSIVLEDLCLLQDVGTYYLSPPSDYPTVLSSIIVGLFFTAVEGPWKKVLIHYFRVAIISGSWTRKLLKEQWGFTSKPNVERFGTSTKAQATFSLRALVPGPRRTAFPRCIINALVDSFTAFACSWHVQMFTRYVISPPIEVAAKVSSSYTCITRNGGTQTQVMLENAERLIEPAEYDSHEVLPWWFRFSDSWIHPEIQNAGKFTGPPQYHVHSIHNSLIECIKQGDLRHQQRYKYSTRRGAWKI